MAQSKSPSHSNSSEETKNETPQSDLGHYFIKVQKAQELLREVYDDTEVFVSVDPHSIVCQNAKSTPYLQTADHVADIARQLEDIRLDIETIARDMAHAQPPDPVTYIHSLSQDSRDLLRQPAPYISSNVSTQRPKSRKHKKRN